MSLYKCPICKSKADMLPSTGDYSSVNCPKCQTFSVTGNAINTLSDVPDESRARVSLSYQLNLKSRAGQENIFLTDDDIENAIKNPLLPTHREQADNLLLYIADKTLCLGVDYAVSADQDHVIIGSETSKGLYIIRQWLIDGKLLEDRKNAVVRLSIDGWMKVDELRKEAETDSTLAFLAMRYGDDEVSNFMKSHIVPAVGECGYLLERLDERPKAGVLDNRMQLMIKQSRFLIVDVTGDNSGAYWEAGYAYGLGKPVIYMCRAKDARSTDKKKRPHFDVDHHQAVFWDPQNPKKACELLKVIIKNTLYE